MVAKSPKLLDQVREVIRMKHYSSRTEKTYADWIKLFILFHGKRHPKEMGAEEVQEYITYLANDRKIEPICLSQYCPQRQMAGGCRDKVIHRIQAASCFFHPVSTIPTVEC